MNAECSNCHHFGERHWNQAKTFEIGRCQADRKKRLTVAKDPEVIKKVKCREYTPIDPNWRPPEKVVIKTPVRNVVEEEPKKKRKVKSK